MNFSRDDKNNRNSNLSNRKKSANKKRTMTTSSMDFDRLQKERPDLQTVVIATRYSKMMYLDKKHEYYPEPEGLEHLINLLLFVSKPFRLAAADVAITSCVLSCKCHYLVAEHVLGSSNHKVKDASFSALFAMKKFNKKSAMIWGLLLGVAILGSVASFGVLPTGMAVVGLAATLAAHAPSILKITSLIISAISALFFAKAVVSVALDNKVRPEESMRFSRNSSTLFDETPPGDDNKTTSPDNSVESFFLTAPGDSGS